MQPSSVSPLPRGAKIRILWTLLAAMLRFDASDIRYYGVACIEANARLNLKSEAIDCRTQYVHMYEYMYMICVHVLYLLIESPRPRASGAAHLSHFTRMKAHDSSDTDSNRVFQAIIKRENDVTLTYMTEIIPINTYDAVTLIRPIRRDFKCYFVVE